jgi:hypothetical protein
MHSIDPKKPVGVSGNILAGVAFHRVLIIAEASKRADGPRHGVFRILENTPETSPHDASS